MTNHPLCVVDQRPVHTAGLLCGACWADLEHDLTELAESLLHDLDITLAGLGRSGGNPIGIVVRSASRGVGFDERAGDLARQLHNCLGGWVRVVSEDNHLALDVVDRPAALATWLLCHRTQVSRHEAVGELWREICDLTEKARRVVDRRPGRRYLGVCSAPTRTEAVLDEHGQELPQALVIERCDADLYAIDDLKSTVDCRQCGTRHHVGARRTVLLDSVGDQLGTAAEISKAVAEYGGVEVTVERIRKWYSRGKIAQYAPRDGDRWPRYRVGDVRELLNPTRKAS